MIYKTKDHNLSDVYALLDRFVKESVYDTEVSKERVASLAGSNQALMTVVYDDATPVAIFVGVAYNQAMFDVRFASDLVLYVVPEKRGGGVAVRLVRMFEDWAKEQKAKYITLGQSTAIGDVDRVRKFYEKLGYQMTGFNTLKEC